MKRMQVFDWLTLMRLCIAALLVSACGEGEEISTRPTPVMVELSGPATFIGGVSTQGTLEADLELDLWLGSFETIAWSEPDAFDFSGTQGVLETSSGECSSADLGASCPFRGDVNVARGLGLGARVEDPRGQNGVWATTLSFFCCRVYRDLFAKRSQANDAGSWSSSDESVFPRASPLHRLVDPR